MYYVNNCDCGEDGLQTLPEWAPVYNNKGAQYRCNVANLLEVSSRKLSDNSSSGYDDWYYMCSKSGNFYTYMESAGAFYTVIGSMGRIAVQPLVEKTGTSYALCGQGRLVLGYTDGDCSIIIPQGVVPACALFRHRFFVGMKNGVLKYSAPEDFYNFTETVSDGGSIRLTDGGGEIIAMKVYDDALYVFCQSGITRLEVGGDPCGFHTEKIDYTGGDIFPRTICVCDHAIYFMSQNGVYRLKGKKPERLELDVILPNKESGLEGCAVWKGLPIFRYQQSDGTYKTLALRADGSAYFLMDLEALGSGENGKVLFIDSQKKLYQLAESGQGSIWTEGFCSAVESDFGYPGRKTLRKLRFVGEGEITVNVEYGHKSLNKILVFENGSAEWPMSERGDKFRLHFHLTRASKIREVIAEFETVASYKEEP